MSMTDKGLAGLRAAGESYGSEERRYKILHPSSPCFAQLQSTMAAIIKTNLPYQQSGDSQHSENIQQGPCVFADPDHRAKVEKSMKRKLDRRCALFVLRYIMNYLDRNNIAAARLKGLQHDLNLDNAQYATCLSILYVGYILMQVPSNILINRIQRPSIYITCAMVLWGALSVLSGITKDFGGMVATRFFLGFVEAAFLPGALLILSKWYTRKELAFRNAILYCGNLISNAFPALIGAGVLSNMQGVLGHAAWRWLFWSKFSNRQLTKSLHYANWLTLHVCS